MIKQAVHLMMATEQREEERYRDKIPTISSVCPLLMANTFILKIPLSLIELIDEGKIFNIQTFGPWESIYLCNRPLLDE